MLLHVKVFHDHQVAADAVNPGKDDGMAVGRKAELFPRPDVTYCERAARPRGKVEEPHHGTILRIQSGIPDSFGNDSERIWPAKRSRNFDWLAARNRHFPN